MSSEELILDVINTNKKYLDILSTEFTYCKIHEILETKLFEVETGDFREFRVKVDSPIQNMMNCELLLYYPKDNFNKHLSALRNRKKLLERLY
jgi:hypothetical protein